MRCSSCGAENLTESQWCSNCGILLGAPAEETGSSIYCTSCGSENSPEVSYCVRCGAEVAGPPERGSRSESSPSYGLPGQMLGNLTSKDLGGLVGETFRVYRGSFWAFFLIALVTQVPFLFAQLIPNLPLVVIFLLVGILLSVVAEGAIIFGVAWKYLGNEVRVGQCYGQGLRRFWSLIGGGIIFYVALFLLAMTFIGLPLFFYLLVVWFFYAQSIMLEGKGPIGALRRSRVLVRGSWLRVFGIGVVFVLIFVGLGLAAGIPGSIASVANTPLAAIIFTVTQSIVMPVGTIGATLVYFDLRIRKTQAPSNTETDYRPGHRT